MAAALPILQFGTSRFLQAHADLFVSEALDRGEALGGIVVVQTTDNPASAARIAALATGASYPVRIRGRQDGRVIDEERRGHALRRGLQAQRDWREVRRIAVEDAAIILSNTGEGGFDLDPRDDASLCRDLDRVPHSFPAKLATLLYERWLQRPGAAASLFPCELIQRNGERLRDIVAGLAAAWGLPAGFQAALRKQHRWANALVDRIVSEPIEPLGAVAEPYALWAIARQEGLVLPCRHAAIVVTDDLDRYAKLKLHILNLGHSFLAERWLRDGRPQDEVVRAALEDDALRDELEAVWTEEVLPVFAAEGLGAEAARYVAEVRDRFANPYLAHRLSDIAQNHAEKKRRRLGPVIAAAERLGLGLAQTRLRKAVG